MAAAPTAPKGKENVVEAVEPASCQANLFDVYIHDDEDSHSSSATPWRALTTEPEPNIMVSNSSRGLPTYRSKWKISKRR